LNCVIDKCLIDKLIIFSKVEARPWVHTMFVILLWMKFWVSLITSGQHW